MNSGPFGILWSLYSIIRVILILLDAVFVFIFIFAATELYRLRPNFVFDPKKPAKKHHAPSHAHHDTSEDAWKVIRAKTAAGTPEAIRIAIIEADGFVDNALKKRGYEGDTFADRLSKVNPDGLDSLEGLWEAHRLRNDVVHTPGFQISAHRAEQALDHYEAFLKEIGVLQKHEAKHVAPPDLPVMNIPSED